MTKTQKTKSKEPKKVKKPIAKKKVKTSSYVPLHMQSRQSPMLPMNQANIDQLRRGWGSYKPTVLRSAKHASFIMAIDCANDTIGPLVEIAIKLCEEDKKKTLAPEHVLGAFKQRMGYDFNYTDLSDKAAKKTNYDFQADTSDDEL